jgi:phosphonopyruvate decarboxylase
VTGAGVAALLDREGFDLFTGVPCSLVEDVIAVLGARPGHPYVAAVREDTALGLAAGAWFGGARPVVLMQNSGLGTGLNALASLSLMYGLPALLLVTWRGYQGKDAPEHLLMGEISPRLLDLLGVPFRVLSRTSAGDDVAWAAREMDVRQIPVALLVPPGVVEQGAAPPAAARPAAAPGARSDGDEDVAPLVPVLSRFDALERAIKRLGDEPAIHANGYLCRESHAIADRPGNFYMIGSMGLASAIGLGLAIARPARTTVVFDGDGNLLMNLGVLAMVAERQPENLVHCVFDNEVYGSTGNQPAPSGAVRLDRLARAAGFRTVRAVTRPEDLDAAMDAALSVAGPHFLLVKVTAAEADVPRIPHAPAAIRDRFRASLGPARRPAGSR